MLQRLDLESYKVVTSCTLENTGYELPWCCDHCLALSADTGDPRLFVSGATRPEDRSIGPAEQYLLVLDATSLELLSAHGREQLCRGACSILHHIGCRHTADGRFPMNLMSIAIVGEELFVVDGNSSGICVYASRTLEPIRAVLSGLTAQNRGVLMDDTPAGYHDYNTPTAMMAYGGRLYLTENTDEDSGFADDDDCPEEVAYRRWVSGKRVVVLTLDGEVLREYVSPGAWPWCERIPGVACETLQRWRDDNLPKHQCFWTSMCVFGGQLILGDLYDDGLSALTALQGL